MSEESDEVPVDEKPEEAESPESLNLTDEEFRQLQKRRDLNKEQACYLL